MSHLVISVGTSFIFSTEHLSHQHNHHFTLARICHVCFFTIVICPTSPYHSSSTFVNFLVYGILGLRNSCLTSRDLSYLCRPVPCFWCEFLTSSISKSQCRPQTISHVPQLGPRQHKLSDSHIKSQVPRRHVDLLCLRGVEWGTADCHPHGRGIRSQLIEGVRLAIRFVPVGDFW